MNQHRLHFMDVTDYGNGIVEAIVDDGVDVSALQLRELIDLLNGLPGQPPCLLINRINHYSLKFEMFYEVPRNKVIKRITIVNHGKHNQFIPSKLWPKNLPVSFFNDYDSGMQWLETHIGSLSQ